MARNIQRRRERDTMVNVEGFVSMNGADKEACYASNSNYQRGVMSYAKHRVENTLAEVYMTISPTCMVTADLGCASGPNPLLVVLQIMDVISRTCHEMSHEVPDVQVFLNDLPGNDFGSIYKSLPDMYHELEERSTHCFVATMPGSFYGRLFPCNSVHFFHSSYALQWISQAPRGLINEKGEPLNKGNICVAETSSHLIRKMYYDQFKQDFHSFPKSRSEEMAFGGGMVLTLIGRVHDDHSFEVIEVIGLALSDMANEGLIKSWKLDAFNMPLYTPSAEEIRNVVRMEGTFSITALECFDMAWDAQMPKEMIHGHETSAANAKGNYVAKYMRAVTELLLAQAFGDGVMDELFRRVEYKYAERMTTKDCTYHNITLSLRKMKEAITNVR